MGFLFVSKYMQRENSYPDRAKHQPGGDSFGTVDSAIRNQWSGLPEPDLEMLQRITKPEASNRKHQSISQKL